MENNYLSDFDLEMNLVKEHYTKRLNISKHLKSSLSNNNKEEYVELALGITDPLGNYSADEHKLGEMIISPDRENKIDQVFDLAKDILDNETSPERLLKLIYKERVISHLKVGVGSEIGSLLKPQELWVCNVRTIWSHLVILNKGDWEQATKDLELYRVDDRRSEMHYKLWTAIYLDMKSSLNYIHKISKLWALEQNVVVGEDKYLWVDAVCNALYEN